MERFVKDTAMAGSLHLPGQRLEIPQTEDQFRMWQSLHHYGLQGFEDLEKAKLHTASIKNQAPLEERVLSQAPINLTVPMKNGKFVREVLTIFQRLGCDKKDLIPTGHIAADDADRSVALLLKKFHQQFRTEILLSPDLSKSQVSGLELLSGYRQILLSRDVSLIEDLTMEHNLLSDKGVIFDEVSQRQHQQQLETWGEIKVFMKVLATLQLNWKSHHIQTFEQDLNVLRMLEALKDSYPLQQKASFVSQISDKFLIGAQKKQTLKKHWQKKRSRIESSSTEHPRKKLLQENFP